MKIPQSLCLLRVVFFSAWYNSEDFKEAGTAFCPEAKNVANFVRSFFPSDFLIGKKTV